jgi:hypothetical protein
MMSLKFLVAVTVLTVTVLAPRASLAQAGSSTISGVVKDVTGGALTGVSMKVVNEDTAVSIETIFSVAGGRTRNQNFILDAGNATNAVGLMRPQQLTSLPVDAMQEFKVITLLNRANFNIPGFTLGAADFGAISSARPARTVQLGTRVSF